MGVERLYPAMRARCYYRADDLARETGLAPTTVRRGLRALAAGRMITCERHGRRHLYVTRQLEL